jgi:hypothetical protein
MCESGQYSSGTGVCTSCLSAKSNCASCKSAASC